MADGIERGDNAGMRYTLEFDVDDLPMLADLMSLGSATAIAYGPQGEAARERLSQIGRQIQAMSPIPKRYRDTGYAWLEACRAARGAGVVWATTRRMDRWRTDAELQDVLLHVDSRTYRVARGVETDAEARAVVARVEDVMARLVPDGADLLVRVRGSFAVEGGYPSGEDARVAAVHRALTGALGEDGETARISDTAWAGSAPGGGSLIDATVHARAGAAERFAGLAAEAAPAAAAPRR